MENVKFDKETKLLLLAALRRGYFTDTDTKTLKDKKIVPMFDIQVTGEKQKKTLENFFEKE